MRKLFVFLISLIFFSCQEKFNPKEFKGTWIPINEKGEFKNLPTITFQNDSVYFEDLYTYVIKGNYHSKSNSIKFLLKNDTIKSDFSFNREDSIITINKTKYAFWEEYSYDTNFINYELIGLKNRKNITINHLSKYDNGFHLFKNNSNSIKLRINDKVTSDFNQIIPFSIVGPIHFDIPLTIIYIGKDIKLNHLLKCYSRLYCINRPGAMLVTSFDLRSNLYSGFRDRFTFWEEQIDNFSNERIERPKLRDNDRKEFIKKYSPQFILINSKEDFHKLNNLKNKKFNLIQINSNMDLKTYISLKEKISEINEKQNVKVKTEFDIFL